MSELGDSWSLIKHGPSSAAGSDVAIPSPESGTGDLQITVGSAAPMMYTDPQTGQLISKEQISASLRQLDTMMGKLEAGRKSTKRSSKRLVTESKQS